MTETTRTAIWAVSGGVIGAVAGGIVGALTHLPGAGPIGVGLAAGAVLGFLVGLPRD